MISNDNKYIVDLSINILFFLNHQLKHSFNAECSGINREKVKCIYKYFVYDEIIKSEFKENKIEFHEVFRENKFN